MKYRKLDFDPSKLGESVTIKPQFIRESAKAFTESTAGGESRYLLPRIEAIHAGTTRNNVRYLAEKLRGDESLKSGVYSWTHPYAKPVISNHDVETEATGRILSAAFSEYTSAGRPGIIVIPKITQEKAIDDILGGRLLTVSIGATTDAAICSICHTDIINDGFCGHMKGEVYEGTKAEWIAGNIWFDELSWVNVPADQDAMIVGSNGLVSTAESFAFNGKELINLGQKVTEWSVPDLNMLIEGMNKDDQSDQRGANTLLTEEEIKALQDELEAAKTAVTELTSEKETLLSEKETLTSEKEQLTEENEKLKTDLEESNTAKTAVEETLAEKEVEVTSTQEALAEKEAEVEALTSTKEALEAEKTTLETSLEEEKEMRAQAVEENANLAKEVHKTIAERVVDLRVLLGKESNREEAVTAYASRSVESLTDSLTDLLKESAEGIKTPGRQVERVLNPGVNNDGNKELHEKKELTAEQVLYGLFGGSSKK